MTYSIAIIKGNYRSKVVLWLRINIRVKIEHFGFLRIICTILNLCRSLYWLISAGLPIHTQSNRSCARIFAFQKSHTHLQCLSLTLSFHVYILYSFHIGDVRDSDDTSDNLRSRETVRVINHSTDKIQLCLLKVVRIWRIAAGRCTRSKYKRM